MKLRQNTLASFLLNEGQRVVKKAYGDSMFPAIPDGTEILIEPVEQNSIRFGDVVYLRFNNDNIFIHRVAHFPKIDGIQYIQTWGDNNAVPDPPQPISEVKGRVVSIKKEGAWQILQNDPLSNSFIILKNRVKWRYIFKKVGMALPILWHNFIFIQNRKVSPD